jgi:chemotaxis protein CheD
VNQDLQPAPRRPQRTVRARDVILQPGDYFVGNGTRVRTLLGSCVSITLWHPRHRVGAMSHFVLADRGAASGEVLDARYGDEALELMRAQLAALGVVVEDCEGKLFGGGDMFPEHSARMTGLPTVGRRNGEAALAMLEAHGVQVRSKHLYGNGHRNIIFDVNNGHVWVRQVKSAGPSR